MQVLASARGTERVFLASAAAFLLVAPFPSSAGWRVFFLLVAALALALRAARREQPLELSRVPRALLVAWLAWAALAVASLAWSVDAGYTVEELRREILYGAIAFVVFFAGTRAPSHLHLWIHALLLSALLLGAAEWLHGFFPQITLFRKGAIGPGHLSTHVLMVAPLLVICAWRAPTGMGKGAAFTALAAAALIAAGMAGDSRIMWLALIVSAVVAFAAFSIDAPADPAGRRAAKRAFLIALALLPVLMLAAAEYKLRYYPLAESTADSLSFDDRPLIWEVAGAKLEERPWFGHGYGREILKADLHQGLARVGARRVFNHGHNVFLDAGLQLGAAGVAAFTLLMGALGWSLWSLRRTGAGHALAVVGLAMLAGYLVKNLTDDFFFRPNSLVFWAIAGMLLGLGTRDPHPGPLPRERENIAG